MNNNYIESNVLEYNNINNIFGFEANVNGETESTYYKKQFRYSSDNILWSDYKDLTNVNLSKVPIYDNKLYIQYKFTKVGNGDLSVESISLNIDTPKASNGGIPECHWMTYNSPNRYMPQIVYTSNGTNTNLFNPYALGNSMGLFNQLSTLISNMFGFCVMYFKTEPNARTRDVVLKEYSIEHVIDKQNVKIMVPDNQLPTRELQFNTMMIDYPVQFEIHIVKSEFWKAFGEESHPDPHDYLYMQAYMNKMYMVDAVSEPDDFGYQGTYWRVSLVPYQELSSVKFNDENLMEDTESLIFSAEGKFEEEFKEEIDDIRKDNQLNDMGDWQEGQDSLRRYLEPNVRIRDEKIYNDWTVVAKQFYDLSTIKKGIVVNEYSYTKGFSSSDERMISFIFKPDNGYIYLDRNLNTYVYNIKSMSNKIGIDYIVKGKKGIAFKLNNWNDHVLKTGNYIYVSKTNQMNGFKKITNVIKSSLIVEIADEYNETKKVFNGASIIGYDTNEMINIRNDEKTLFDLSQIGDRIIVNINGSQKIYTLDIFNKPKNNEIQKGFESKWYALILGMNRGISTLWVYEFEGSDKKENRHSKIKLIGKCSSDFGEFDFGDTCYYDIMSCNSKLTNFRLWSKLCEEDKHELILSQYIIDDTHNTLIVDNAQNELLLNNKWS